MRGHPRGEDTPVREGDECGCSAYDFPHRHRTMESPSGRIVNVVEAIREDDGMAVRDPDTGDLIFEPSRKHLIEVVAAATGQHGMNPNPEQSE